MNLVKVIEAGHNKVQCMKVVAYVGNSSQKFKELLEVFLQVRGSQAGWVPGNASRITQRAGWPLSICVEHHPELALPHIKTLIKFAATPGVHNSVRRNVFRLLQFMVIPKRYHGAILDMGFKSLANKSEEIAIKVFALTVVFNIIKDGGYPELGDELAIVIEDEMHYATPAFRSRGSKILRKLRKGIA